MGLEMAKTIGVAIATFNGLKYLPEQLSSIINQTRRPDSISISDDGSTDGTIEYIRRFSKESKIAVKINVNHSNLGVIENFIKAFEGCETDYIAYCDQDDVWHENKIATALDVLQRTGAALFFHRSEIVDENLKTQGRHHPHNIKTGIYTYPHFPDHLWGYGHQMIFTRRVLEVMKGIRLSKIPSIAECGACFDGSLLVAAGMVGHISYAQEDLVKFRRHPNATSPAGLQIKKNLQQAEDARRARLSYFYERIKGLMLDRQDEPVCISVGKAEYFAYQKHLRQLQKRYKTRTIIYSSSSREHRLIALTRLFFSRSYGSSFENKAPLRQLLVDSWRAVRGAP
jgi:glycosyltransferase involved in cell wall biosynthesis